MVTRNDTLRGVDQLPFWAQDSKTLLYLEDCAGDENYHLWAAHALDPTAPARDLTPFYGKEPIQACNILTSPWFPNELLVGLNSRAPHAVFDMYRCNYQTGQLELDTLNPGDVVGWGCETRSFQVRAATVRNQDDSSTTIRFRACDRRPWRDLVTFPYGEVGTLVDFCNDGTDTCWMTSSVGRDTTALLRVDLQTGATLEEVFAIDKCDCGGAVLDPATKKLRAVGFNYARLERTFWDPDLENDYRVLQSLGPVGSDVVVYSKTRDETLWTVGYQRSDGPTEFFIYDQISKSTKPLFVDRPELLQYKLAAMADVRIIARDGTELVAYLTRVVTDRPTPLVLLVHGGPWDRDYWGFDATSQWFANRGYATLQVNYRGSSGYGKTFLHKGDRQWGVGDMQHDLTDAVRWAVEQGIADSDKVCIYGGSYGGYACLAGLAFTPDLYCCGVDIVGPSNIRTLLNSIPPYWGPLRKAMVLKIGDVEADEAFNRKISPLFHIDQIQAPLLIGHGANDPRVKQSESDAIAFSMSDKGIPVEYIVYPDEGHGFGRPANRLDFMGRAELFLAKHLGGRAQEFIKPSATSALFPLEFAKPNCK